MTSHILWQNAAKTTTLLDIPQSIVEAQGFNSPGDYYLLSSQSRDEPYPSNEPKTAKGKAKLAGNSVDNGLDAEYRVLLIQALQEVRQHHAGKWCLPRYFVTQVEPQKNKKRKLNEAADLSCEEPHAADAVSGPTAEERLPEYFLSKLARADPESYEIRLGLEHDSATASITHTSGKTQTRFHANDSDNSATLTMSTGESDGSFSFRIPPKSSFYLGDCAESHDFRQAIRRHSDKRGRRPAFDFILLDPPWPNRSVKRTHKTAGATYNTISSIDDLGDMIFDMQLDALMAEEALVGIWITNRQAARELVLGQSGLFECWDVELSEEWLWLKTTTSGEPTTVLDALWKKPYEVLLLGRKRRVDANESRPDTAIKRRVIIGVPDLHSRKPCLRSLVASIMAKKEKYEALEVFARHLVSGWCSWGDECIKFNWKGYWRKREGS